MDVLRIENPRGITTVLLNHERHNDYPSLFDQLGVSHGGRGVGGWGVGKQLGDLTCHYHSSNVEQGLTFIQKTS